ncbi:unnamed protein product [Tuber melanosporum]|uniref:(Perigord truffle) hypothetical protein n=1 Tax=Tuber melanosporum (strain Mel28) TaxID=656061 RepID=D5GNZ1_TUBMM|nr:uncharacterized protein GSTUM_00011592001 [Tuber melanosporum]CAZ86234.1 unnamed protein product [Tuber melanosporum]
MPLTRTAKTPIHLVSPFAPKFHQRSPYEELEEPLHPSNNNQGRNNSHNSIATNSLNLGGGKTARGVAGEGASRPRSAGKKKPRASPIGTAGLKVGIEMSQISSDYSRTQSPASSAFPAYFRRDRNTLAVESLPELPNSDASHSEHNHREEEGRRDSGGGEKKKDAVFYAPIPEKQKLGYLSTAALIINKMIGTGIFSKPSSILRNTGSKGGALFLWVTGGVMTLTGLFVYLEFGVALPFNGGELVYLDEAYARPRYFASCMFAIFFVLLGNTAANTIAFAKHMLVAFNDKEPVPDYRLQKFVALVCITFICLIHLFSRKMGIFINNALAVYKVALLLFVVISGFVCLGGGGGGDHKGPYGAENLKDAFEGSSGSPYHYASAMLGVLYSYQGWENANYVLAEVKRPRGHESRTFKRAALVAFTVVTVLYILANVAYFAASTTDEIMKDGVTVAASFFIKVFGDGPLVTRGLKVLIALSAFGNVVAVTYANARVKQEIAKQRILPFSAFWASTSPYGTPVGALILHWIFTVIVIVAVPNYGAQDEAYNLVSVLFTYGHTWIGIFVSLGLISLPFHEKFREWRPAVVSIRKLYGLVALYITLNIFVIVLIWWPDPNAKISSYVAPSVGTSVLGFGVLYWVGFAKILPALGYHIDSEPDELVDGSRVVTYKRYKTGPALVVADWWERTFQRQNL